MTASGKSCTRSLAISIGRQRAAQGTVHELLRQIFALLFHLGALGLIILGILDSSFLFLPVGNDLLLIALVARNHGNFLIYLLAASFGSATGVVLLDLATRTGGEEGLKKLMSQKRVAYLKKKMKQHAAIALVVASLAPPPFPFTAVIASASALQYPRLRLITVVFGARAARFALVGLAAIWLQSDLLRIANSTWFAWFMAAFTALCLIGSVVSVIRWIRLSRSTKRSTA
jgi:membrane protein YqaA with SNARE-associated domain